MPFVRDDGRLIPKPAAASWADCRHAGVVVFGHVLLHPGLVDLPPTFVAGNLCLVVGHSWRQKSAFKKKKKARIQYEGIEIQSSDAYRVIVKA